MRPTSINIISNNEGEQIPIAGGNYRIVLSGEQTENALAVIEMVVPANGGPGPHAHASFQECFFVLEGEVTFKSETQTYKAVKGDMVHIPRGGAVHCFKNETDQTARLLCMVTPAGLDAFFREASKLPPPVNDEARQNIFRLGESYGQEFFPPDFLDK